MSIIATDVVVYSTSDGEEYRNPVTAQAHERHIQVVKFIEKNIDMTCSHCCRDTPKLEEVADDILKHRKALVALLTKEFDIIPVGSEEA